MLLAEALILRKDLQQRLSLLEGRLFDSARVQEGDRPPEDPQQLLAELERVTDELALLIARINHCNSRRLENGETLTQMLAQRDMLQEKLRILRSFGKAAADIASRQTRTEIRLLATVDVAALRKQEDALAKTLRELDTRIQAMNWQTELT